MRKLQAHKLLEPQEQEARHTKDRAQEVLQMVQGPEEAQGGQEISLIHKRPARGFCFVRNFEKSLFPV